MARANDNTQAAPIKIRRADWKRLPEEFKAYIGGSHRVLTRADGVTCFRPVHIL